MPATFLVDLADTTVLGRTVSSAAATTATANGTSVDMQLSDGSVHALIDCSAASGTTPQVVVQLQYSSDNSTWTNIPADSTNEPGNATLTAAGLSILSTNQRLGRYMRAALTVTGTTPSFTLSVILIAQKKIVGNSGTQLNYTPGSGF